MIDEGDIDFNGLTDTGIVEMLGYVFSVGFVRQPFADLGQIVLTIGIVNVGLVVCHRSFYKRDKPGILLLTPGGKDAEDTASCHINRRGAESLGGLCQPRGKECTRNDASADVTVVGRREERVRG